MIVTKMPVKSVSTFQQPQLVEVVPMLRLVSTVLNDAGAQNATIQGEEGTKVHQPE